MGKENNYGNSMIEPNVIERQMDKYDLELVDKIKKYGTRLEEFDKGDIYSVHVYSYIFEDGRAVQAALILYRGECIEYFIRDLD